jgi:hypothetical protein
MREYKVVYESINGQSKSVMVKESSRENAENYVLCHYPDCLQVLSVI